MNGLSRIFLNIKDSENIVFERDKIYHVRQDDSFEIEGYFCSNTAKKHENPNGLRRSAIFLKNKKNIVVDGNGAKIIVHGKMTPMLFDGCENITVKNLTVDYACPTMSEFTVVSNNGGECVIKINAECRFRIDGNDLIWLGEDGLDGNPYWEDSYIGNRRHIKIFNPQTRMSYDFRRDDLAFDILERIDACTLKIQLKNKDALFPAGYVVQTRNIIRDQTGSLFQRCKNLTFEGLRIKFMHGLGMVSQFCENVEFLNCDLTPAEGRTITSTADFFQFSGCRGQLTVKSCKAWGAQDDYINVHGTHLRVVEKDDLRNSITVRFMHPETWGIQAFEAGDKLEFIKWDTLIPYAETRVLRYEKLNDTDIKLWFDRPLPEIEIGKDVVENATWTPDLHVTDCDFGPTSGRGILCTTRGKVVIENNVFHELKGPALLVEDDCNFWFESGCTKEIVFRNNRVINCDYSQTFRGAPAIRYSPKVINEDSKEFVHGRLVLSGNSFEKSVMKTHLLHLEYLKEAEITDNYFDAPYIIETVCVGKITDKNKTAV